MYFLFLNGKEPWIDLACFFEDNKIWHILYLSRLLLLVCIYTVRKIRFTHNLKVRLILYLHRPHLIQKLSFFFPPNLFFTQFHFSYMLSWYFEWKCSFFVTYFLFLTVLILELFSYIMKYVLNIFPNISHSLYINFGMCYLENGWIY